MKLSSTAQGKNAESLIYDAHEQATAFFGRYLEYTLNWEPARSILELQGKTGDYARTGYQANFTAENEAL